MLFRSGSQDSGHLLNVSAGAMSAWSEDPSHLLRWLDLNGGALADLLPQSVEPTTFLPRQIYGLYLQSILEEAASRAPQRCTLERLGLELVDLEPLAAGSTRLQDRERQRLPGHVHLTQDHTRAW